MRPACSSTATDKPAGAETPGRAQSEWTKKEHPDEGERAKAKMVTAKATPRLSPRKSKAMPQHEAARVVRTRYHEAAACPATFISGYGERPHVEVGQNTEHMLGRSEETCENDERLRRYQHAALPHRRAKTMIWRKVSAATLSKRQSRRWTRVGACCGSRDQALCQNDECTRGAGQQVTNF